ncbi:MAG: murein biosynthesis integral membrane protein MurJ [Actinomycetota bacterium]|nr:murein biosynthesis integral membrane protein MurJ [Actinomycetota bacterium]MDP3630080.1 murein biosynthesis integral membrane protein MurJ [Actinomycetota bacterium]
MEPYRLRGGAITAQPSIARSTAAMSVATAVSRITGFIRTWAMAYALGVTVLSASYSVANNIPNMIYELVAGGVMSSTFIPLFIERLQRDGEDEAWRFASYVFNITVLALSVVAIIGMVWAEPFVRTQTFRISPEKAALAVHLFRFFAVQVVFYGAAVIWTGVLNSYRKFAWPAVGPIFNNLVVIITMFGFYLPFKDSHPQLAINGLAIGTTLGVVVMAFVQVPALLKLGGHYTPRIDWHHPALKTIARKMGPTAIYAITNLVAVSFRNAYAFQMSDNGPAVLAYAWMFYQLPYGIFAVALATAIFPELSALAEKRDWPGFREMFARGFRSTAVLIVPLATLLVALATPVIRLYRAGSFTAADVPVVAGILVWWASGLFFFASYMFVLRTFYSLQDTKTPMLTNIAATVLQVSLYALLTGGIAGWGGLGLKGIPIADCVFFVVHLAVLAFLLRRRIGGYDTRGIAWTVVRVFIASLFGAGAALGVMQLTGPVSGGAGFVAQLVLAGISGLCVTYSLAALLRVNEVRDGATRLKRMLSRRPKAA